MKILVLLVMVLLLGCTQQSPPAQHTAPAWSYYVQFVPDWKTAESRKAQEEYKAGKITQSEVSSRDLVYGRFEGHFNSIDVIEMNKLGDNGWELVSSFVEPRPGVILSLFTNSKDNRMTAEHSLGLMVVLAFGLIALMDACGDP
jgi:hypothetical protein